MAKAATKTASAAQAREAASAALAANGSYTPRLRTVYDETIRKTMQEKFSYKNPMEVPRIDKVVLNMGVGEATADSKKPSVAAEDLSRAIGPISTSGLGPASIGPPWCSATQ